MWPRDSVSHRPRTQCAAPGNRSLNVVDVTAAAAGIRGHTAPIVDQLQRERGRDVENGGARKEQSMVECVCVRGGRTGKHVQAGGYLPCPQMSLSDFRQMKLHQTAQADGHDVDWSFRPLLKWLDCINLPCSNSCLQAYQVTRIERVTPAF